MSSWIGRDIKPRIGTRVQLDSRLGNRGTGTIIGMPPDALTCSVQWDSGAREDNLAIGEDSQFYLLEASASTVQQPRRTTMTSRSLSPAPRTYASESGRLSAAPREAAWAGDRKKAQTVIAAQQNRGMDWLEEATNYSAQRTPSMPQRSSTISRTSSAGKSAANISNAVTTIGLSVYGTQVDHLLPRGPAHLSQQLDKNDEILEVDGQPVNQQNIAQAIVGSDLVNTTVKLTIRKALPGNPVREVELMRVAKRSVDSMVELFHLLTQLKQNGHNVEDYEQNTAPPGSVPTVDLVDKVTDWISHNQMEKYNADLRTRNQFQELYSELRTHLSEAYLEIDKLESQQRGTGNTPKNIVKAQVDKLAAELAKSEKELQDTRLELQEERKRTGRTTAAPTRQASVPPAPTDQSDLQSELEEKKQLLAQEIESGMQKDFEIKKLQGQAEILQKQSTRLAGELDSLRAELAASEQEMLRIRKEDAILEEKITQLQEHLDDNAAEEAAMERMNKQLEEALAVRQGELEEEFEAKLADLQSRLTTEYKGEADDVRRQLEDNRKELLASERKAAASEDKARALQEELIALGEQLKEERSRRDVEASRLHQEVRRARFREGDVLDVLVDSATGVQGEPGGESEVYVMLNIDDKHQVQQTSREPVHDGIAQFGQNFTAELNEASKTLVVSAYTCRPKQPGELLGSSRITITDAPFGTEKEVELVLESEPEGGEKVHEVVTKLRMSKANVTPRRTWVKLPDRDGAAQRTEPRVALLRDAGREGDLLMEIETFRKKVASLEQDCKGEAQASERERLRADRLQREVDMLSRELNSRRSKMLEDERRLSDELSKSSGRENQILQLQQQIVELHKQRDEEAHGEKASREEALRRAKEDARMELAEEVRSDTRKKLKEEVKEEAKREAGEEMRVELTKQIQGELARKVHEKEYKGLQELEGSVKQLRTELEAAKEKQAKTDSALAQEADEKAKFEAEVQNMLRGMQEQSREISALRVLNESLQDDRERLEPITNQDVLSPPTPGFAAYNKDSRSPAMSTAKLTPPPNGTNLHASASSPPPGVVGVSIASNPPFTVMSISELMDEFGNTINDRVRLGDELLDVNGVRALDIPSGELALRIAGPAGTTVNLRFLDPGTKRVFSISALRHLPFAAKSSPPMGGPGPTNLLASYPMHRQSSPPMPRAEGAPIVGVTLLS